MDGGSLSSKERMEITDYNSKLADVKASYSDTASELKSNLAAEKKGLEKLHAKRQKNSLNSFINAKEDLEAQNKKSHDRYAAETRKEIQKRSDRFIKDLSSTKSEFGKTQKENKRGYDAKLKNISTSFSTQMKERDRLGKLRTESAEGRFKEAAFQNQRSFDKNLSSIQKNNTKEFNSFRDEMLIEKQGQELSHMNEKKLLTQDASISQGLLKNTFQKEKQILRDSYAISSSSQKNHTDNQLDNIKINSTIEKEKLKENFEYLAEKITAKGNSELRKLQNENREDLLARESKFANSRLSLEQKINKAVANGENDQSALVLRKNKESYESRLNNYDHRLSKMNHSHQEDKSRGIEKQQEARINMKIKHRRELDKQESITRNVRKDEMGGLREKQQEQIEKIMQSRDMVGLTGEEKIQSESLAAGMKLKNQREDIIRQMNKANEKNQDQVRGMAKTFSEEQSKFIATEKRKFNQDKADIRAKMSMDRTVAAASYEDKITSLEGEKKRIIESYEDKLGVQMNKSTKEIQRREIAENERKVEAQRANARTLKQKDREAYLTLVKQKGDFNKKLEEQQSQQEIKLTYLTRKYEDMIIQERLEAKQSKDLAVNLERNNYKKLKEAKEIEMHAMDSKYTLKIEKLKNANKGMQIAQSMRNNVLENKKG